MTETGHECRECGEKTESREERIEHQRERHTPAPEQWAKAYQKILGFVNPRMIRGGKS